MKKKAPQLKTLDLHGFRQDEVYDAVDKFLMKNSRQKQLRIMTGKGKGLVQKQVLQYLKQAGYPWVFEKMSNGSVNNGCLIVFVDE